MVSTQTLEHYKELFPVGSEVRLKPKIRHARVGRDSGYERTLEAEVANIECHYADIEGGVRLTKPLLGFVSWNVSDLDLVDNRKPGPESPD